MLFFIYFLKDKVSFLSLTFNERFNFILNFFFLFMFLTFHKLFAIVIFVDAV